MAQHFDPAAATAAYLAQLPPAAHAKATAYTQGGHWLLLWGALVAVAIALLVLRSGLLVRLRARIEARKARPWLAGAAVIALYTLIETLLSLPWTIYSGWWREASYGLTSQPLSGYLGELTLNTAIVVVVTVFMFSLLYWVIRRTARRWWLWGGGLTGGFIIVMMVLAPVFVQPLFNTYQPAPPGPVRDAVVAIAIANGVPHDKIYIYDGSRQSNRYTANVSGLFGTARIAMSDVMFAKGADLPEVKAVVGHEMGHYVHMHAIWMALAFGGLALVSFFLVDRLFAPVVRLTGAKGVTGLSDPAGFPAISIILAVLGLLGAPFIFGVTRAVETDADRYSLAHVNEPDGLAQALVKTIEYRAATPSELEETLFYDHPAVGSRVRMAMDWKAAQAQVDEVR